MQSGISILAPTSTTPYTPSSDSRRFSGDPDGAGRGAQPPRPTEGVLAYPTPIHRFEARIVRYDKANRTSDMHHIDYGLGVFDRRVFASIPAGAKRDLTAVYQGLLEAGKLVTYEVHERFYEIGSPEGLRDATAFLGTNHQSD